MRKEEKECRVGLRSADDENERPFGKCGPAAKNEAKKAVRAWRQAGCERLTGGLHRTRNKAGVKRMHGKKLAGADPWRCF